MTRIPTALAVFVCVTLLVLLPSVGAAASIAELEPAAKEAFLNGLKSANQSFDGGLFEEALSRYDALIAQVSLPELHFRRGACLERLGRLAEAAGAYRKYVELAPDAKDVGRVQFDIERLEQAHKKAQGIHLVVTSRPTGAEVRDGGPNGPILGHTPVDLERPSGATILYLSAAGHDPVTRPFTLDTGERLQVEIVLGVPPVADFEPADPVVDEGPRTLTWVLAGSSLALGAGAGVLGFLANHAIDEANTYDRRGAGNSRSDLEDLQDQATGYKTAFWITGGLAVAAGLGAAALHLFGGPVEKPGQASVGRGGVVVRF